MEFCSGTVRCQESANCHTRRGGSYRTSSLDGLSAMKIERNVADVGSEHPRNVPKAIVASSRLLAEIVHIRDNWDNHDRHEAEYKRFLVNLVKLRKWAIPFVRSMRPSAKSPNARGVKMPGDCGALGNLRMMPVRIGSSPPPKFSRKRLRLRARI
jgi:hypothetical protein